MRHIVIIGNGIAGITAARHIRKKSDARITVVSGESEHFFSRTALMYIYMGHMEYRHTKPYEDWFWKKNKIDLKKAWVSAVEFDQNTVVFEGGEMMTYDTLILATGSQSNKIGGTGEQLKGVQGLYSLQDLAQMEAHTQGIKQAVIVGGGLIGVEMAEMLHARNIEVTYLIREPHFWAGVLPKEEGSIIDRHLLDQHIDLMPETVLAEIIGDENGRVAAIVTQSGEQIPCQFVGITIGVHPNLALVANTEIETDRGILVDEYLRTSKDNVYAIGDCAQLRMPPEGRRPIEAVWYVGRMMGETVAQTLTGAPTSYQPGIWFNSAKFFDIEYQTYGTVTPQLGADENQFYWESSKGDQCIKIVFDKASNRVKGVNLLGMRHRHEVWDGWLREQKKIDDVIDHLEAAHFDPEFFKRYEGEIKEAFNEAFPERAVRVRRRFRLKRRFLAK